MLAVVTISDGLGEPVELHNFFYKGCEPTCTLEYQVFNESNCRFVLKGLAKNLEMKMKHGVMPKQTLSLKLYSDVLEDDMYIEQLVTVK